MVVTIPCLSDNLAYLVIERRSNTAIVIDPSESSPVFRTLDLHPEVTLKAALLTHHHPDHIGGLPGLPAMTTWSSERDLNRIPGAGGTATLSQNGGIRRTLRDGDFLSWKDLTGVDGSIAMRAIAIPGHTEGQMAYVFTESASPETPDVFVGDTLFSFGCGRCLEGTPEELFQSLQKLKQELKPSSRMHFGHEYTLRNLEFWKSHENEWLKRGDVDSKTLAPAAITPKHPRPAPLWKDELTLNPFLKIKTGDEFARWRELRNQF